MKEVFLSASVPVVGRSDFYTTADPYLIQCAVRELVITIIEKYILVWGGHPAITPMISEICKDLSICYEEQVILYQSRYFESEFPSDNSAFRNVVYTESVGSDKNASLGQMREEIFQRDGLCAAVFIGGMEGIFEEYEMFKRFHPAGKVVLVPSTGGASLALAKRLAYSEEQLKDVDYTTMFNAAFIEKEGA